MRGNADVVHGLKSKIAIVVTNVLPGNPLAAGHREMSEPKR